MKIIFTMKNFNAFARFCLIYMKKSYIFVFFIFQYFKKA